MDLGGKMPSSDNNVNKVEEEIAPPKFQPKRECYCCGGNHDPSSCKYKNEVYYKCQKKGHMAKVCKGKKKPQKQGRHGRRPDGKQRTHFVEESADQDDVYAMYHLSSDRKKSLKVDLELCGGKNTMEIDTGASKTILNEATYGRLRDALGPLQTRKAALSMYTGERIPVLGAVMVPVEYKGKKKELEQANCRRQRTKLAWSRLARTNPIRLEHNLPHAHGKRDKPPIGTSKRTC